MAWRETITYAGVLHGQGHEAACTVRCVKVNLPGTDGYEFVRHDIVGLSNDLPEGIYALTGNGQTMNVQFRDGSWTAAPSIVR